jgi:hypothetical protein
VSNRSPDIRSCGIEFARAEGSGEAVMSVLSVDRDNNLSKAVETKVVGDVSFQHELPGHSVHIVQIAG